MSTICPSCNSEYDALGSHWAHSTECTYPDISEQKREIIIGLLMGDGSVKDRGSAGRFSMEMCNESFVEWVDEKLGVLSLGVKNYRDKVVGRERTEKIGSQQVKDTHQFDATYELKSRGHPFFKELRQWYTEDGKQFPEDLTLTPQIAKMWYCCDGSLIKSDKQNPHARFYTKNERSRLETLVSYFTEQGLDARKYEGAVGFTVDGTKQLLNWMGKPPNGMEYKWI